MYKNIHFYKFTTKLFKVTISGIDKKTSKEDLLKNITTLSEVNILRLSKDYKQNYCQINLKTKLSISELRTKFENYKILNKNNKIRIKEVDKDLDYFDKDILNSFTSDELKTTKDLNNLILSKYKDKEYLTNIKNFISNLDDKNFLIPYKSSYFEAEYSILHLNDIDNYKPEGKKNFKIEDIKYYKIIELNSNFNLKDSSDLPYSQYRKISDICLNSLDLVLSNFNFFPYLDLYKTIWRGFKIQIYENNIVVTLMFSISLLSKADILHIKQAIIYKFHSLFSHELFKVDFFISINEQKGSKISKAEKFIDLKHIDEASSTSKNELKYFCFPWKRINPISKYLFESNSLSKLYIFDPFYSYVDGDKLTYLITNTNENRKLFNFEDLFKVFDKQKDLYHINYQEMDNFDENSIIFINLNSVLTSKTYSTVVKDMIVKKCKNNQKISFFSQSILELFDYIKVFTNENIKYETVKLEHFKEETYDNSFFVLQIKLIC